MTIKSFFKIPVDRILHEEHVILPISNVYANPVVVTSTTDYFSNAHTGIGGDGD